ncbi:MAG: DUF1992 domain-containing protein [Betaproteobacteria bacterium HGW-Betaproteobacteria-13]|jgi:hypothetical protein|uniref:DnaJ homologue subfamily C member 28 conserved domain-containing protein n=1 Tax=Parazoarcus communis TaxID=41977 RepID=A0A2U8H0Q7_9RHOO|nr:DUF1992 domain-containing protein [Parazoarcus communis]AWI79304.1 hypothetical protein CEW87_07950 [Parazoarcus communis]PKO81961.1 MAG: DUF1992 domain-containing protein [Betaproteobacteria bacterium HGW-Betaproteobacteria-13]
MSIFEILAEQRIADAIRRGELDNLPGAGRPLVFDDELFLSGEQRMINRVLKNAGFTPPEVRLRKELADLREALARHPDDERRELLQRELNMVLLRLGALRRH